MAAPTKRNAEVYRVLARVPGLPNVLLGDSLILWEDGEVTLQRQVDVETLTGLGTANALEFMPQRHQLDEILTKATAELRDAVKELTESHAGGAP